MVFLLEALLWFQISHFFPRSDCVLNLGPGTVANIAANIDHEDLIGHVDFPFMHIVQHFFGSLGPDLIVAGMAEHTNTDDDISFQRQALLGLHESILESSATAQGDDLIISLHINSFLSYNG